MVFKIAVVDKAGKFHKYLSAEYRYLGRIWYEKLVFNTKEEAEEYIKENYDCAIRTGYTKLGYTWVVKRSRIYRKCIVPTAHTPRGGLGPYTFSAFASPAIAKRSVEAKILINENILVVKEAIREVRN